MKAPADDKHQPEAWLQMPGISRGDLVSDPWSRYSAIKKHNNFRDVNIIARATYCSTWEEANMAMGKYPTINEGITGLIIGDFPLKPPFTADFSNCHLWFRREGTATTCCATWRRTSSNVTEFGPFGGQWHNDTQWLIMVFLGWLISRLRCIMILWYTQNGCRAANLRLRAWKLIFQSSFDQATWHGK